MKKGAEKIKKWRKTRNHLTILPEMIYNIDIQLVNNTNSSYLILPPSYLILPNRFNYFGYIIAGKMVFPGKMKNFILPDISILLSDTYIQKGKMVR